MLCYQFLVIADQSRQRVECFIAVSRYACTGTDTLLADHTLNIWGILPLTAPSSPLFYAANVTWEVLMEINELTMRMG